MNCKEFVVETVCGFSPMKLTWVKKLLIGQFIDFSILRDDEISASVLGEKLCDFFEKVEFKTGKNFDRQIESYMFDIDSVIGPHVGRVPQGKKNDETPLPVPRARKYYEKAASYRHSRNLTASRVVDYSRVMFCIYMAHINNGKALVDDFDFSPDSLDASAILKALKNEEMNIAFPPAKRKRFSTRELYNSDVATLILAILCMGTTMNDNEQGENHHE